jgi:hypothetical protein
MKGGAMEDKSPSNLIPTDDEIKELLKQVAQYPPSQAPVILLQLYFTRLMLKKIGQVKEELDKEADKLMKKLSE